MDMVSRTFAAAAVLGILPGALAAGPSGEEHYYRIVTLPVPEGVVLEVGGLAVLPDGRVAAAVRRGEVWLIDNATADSPDAVRFRRFASGLHEPLGLLEKDGAIYVVQRSELTRLRDLDGDGAADEYLTVGKGWGLSGNYHEYAYGPVLDRNGDFLVTLNATLGRRGPGGDAWRGWGMKVTAAGGRLLPVCAGLRSPSGIGRNAAGDVFYTDQQGEWIPTNTLSHIETGDFFGHPAALRSASLPGSPLRAPGRLPAGKTVAEVARLVPSYKLPAVWFPYRKVGQSATGIACDLTAGRFGPFAGQLFVGEFTLSGVSRVFLEKVRGAYQGACFPFRSGFACGVFRLAFAADGSLLAGETNRGWNSLGPRAYGLERLVWTGRVPFEIREMRARPDGFELVFTLPVDGVSAGRAASYSMRSYTYRYHGSYGSPEVDARDLEVRSSEVSEDGLRVRLRVEGLREAYVHELRLPGVRSAAGDTILNVPACYTLNRIPSPSPPPQRRTRRDRK